MFAVTSSKSIGCTFFDWSLHYLSGQTEFYSARKKSVIPLVSNPLNGVNAHGHLKNHPRGLRSTKSYLDQLLQHQGNTSLYPTGLSLTEAARDLGVSFPNLQHKSDLQSILTYINNDYHEALECIIDATIPLIYVDVTPDVALYFITPRTRDAIITKTPDGTLYSIDEIQTAYQQAFFSESIQQWNDLGLTSRWDERERLALCLRPFELGLTEFKTNKPHLKFNCKSWWADSERVILQSLDFLQLKLDNSRLQSWRDVHRTWHELQFDSLNFVFTYKDIVDSIVNGHWMYIDLTFEQEVIIQHCLIYQHGLNLKTWQLEKFPNNTVDLHKLLESNIHSVPKIY